MSDARNDDAIAQLRAAVRSVAGVDALTGKVRLLQIDVVAGYEATRWASWRRVRRTRRVDAWSWADAAAIVRSIECQHEALVLWSPPPERGVP
jgi:hypothetical protein